MASTYIPRIARAHTSLKVLHPHIQQAQAHLAHLGGGGGVGAGFGNRGGSAGGSRGNSNDPAVTGTGFDQTNPLRFLGLPLEKAQLTETGKNQKSDYDALRSASQMYAQMHLDGASDQEATSAIYRAFGAAPFTAMLLHPDAPLSKSSFGDAMRAQSQKYTQIQGADRNLYQAPVDESGRMGPAERVEGLPDAPQAPEKKTLLKTDQGYAQLDANGRATPVLDANGRQMKPPLTAAEMKAQGGANPVAHTTAAMTQELTNINTVLENIGKLKNSIGGTGAFVGGINRYIAEKTPLTGSQGEAYNEAYNQMRPALLALTRAPGQNSKLYGNVQLDQLPDPNHAQLYNIGQVIPSIELQMRERLGMLTRNYSPQADNRPGAYSQALSLAKTYDAHPDMMQDLQAARATLQRDPRQLTGDQINLLKTEADGGRLPADDWMRTQRQAWQRGLTNKPAFEKMVASNSDLGNFPPQEVLPQNSPYRKQVPQDRTQAAQQAATLPPTPVETVPEGGQAPQQQQPVPPEGMPTGEAGSTLAPQQQQQQAPMAAPATPAGQTPVTPAQQPMAQPATGQSSGGVPPAAGGTQPLAPSASAPLPPLSQSTLQLLQQNNVPTGAIENQ